MNKLNHYVPMMNLKQGELKAIKELAANALEKITPFFDVPRIAIVSGERTNTLDGHINKTIANIEKYCKDIPFILDYSLFDLQLRLENKMHPLKYLYDALFEKNIIFIPAIGLDRDEEYLKILKDFLHKTPSPQFCLRLQKDDFDSIEETQQNIGQMLSFLNISADKCDLVIDFKCITENEVESFIDSLSELNQLIAFVDFHSFVLAASGFPSDMSDIPPDSHGTVKRIEYDLWLAAINAAPLIGRKPKFGDYCIVNPDRPEIDSVKMRPGGKIRYTTSTTWEIFRGHNLKKGQKFSQYFELAKKVMGSSYFLGGNFSWGDKYIAQCATEAKKTGNLPVWMQVDINHHLTLVGEQIANSGVFSESD